MAANDDKQDNQAAEPPPVLVGGDSIYVESLTGVQGVAIGAGARAEVFTYQGLTIEEVAELVVALQHKDQPQVWDGRIPYLGLKAYQESDAEFFFGREELVDDLLRRVQQSNFVAIAGPSGSGKSSVARAGLFYALRQGRLERSDTWLLAAMQPKGDPLGQLALAVDRLARSVGAGDHIREHGLENPRALHEQVEVLLSDDAQQRCVLLVDQFEEVFTQTKDKEVRKAFIDLLTTAVQEENGRLIIILCLRSDFISNCALHNALTTLLGQKDHFKLVSAMAPRDLAKAITLPCLEVGAEIGPALIKQIIDDMKGEPGALPLMSFALRDLFIAEKSEEGRPMDLTLQEYMERGGIDSALERHANEVFTSFTAEQQALARIIFSRLIEVGKGRADTRRTAVFQQLVPAGVDAVAVAGVISKLAAADVRLVTTSGIEDDEELTIDKMAAAQTAVAIAHEKLIDAWPWLQRLVDENRDLIALCNQISDDAQKWTAEKDPGYLYRGGRLLNVQENLDALGPGLDDLSRRFVQASIDEQQRRIVEENRQRRRRNMIYAGAALVSFVLALTAFMFFLQSSRNAQTAEENLERANLALTAEATAVLEAQANLAIAKDNAATATRNLATAEAAQATSAYNERQAESQAAAALDAQETAVKARGTAEAASTRALIQSEKALAQSLMANSRALTSSQLDSQELARARLLALEGAALNEQVGSPAEKNSGAGLLFSLAYYQPATLYPGPPLPGHTTWATAVEWHPDGSLLASGDLDGVLIIWDSARAQQVATLTNHNNTINSIAWSLDGRRLATGADDGIIIWDTETWQPEANLTEISDWTNSVAWNKDGSRLAAAAGDSSLVIWDSETWLPQKTLTGHAGGIDINSVSWNFDNSRLASGAYDGLIIWDTETWQPQTDLTEQSDRLNSVAWNKDGSLLAAASSDDKIDIWDTQTWQPLLSLTEPSDRVETVSWSEDGSLLASASDDGTIIIWDTDSWGLVTILAGHKDYVYDVAWNEDGTRLASAAADDTVIIWEDLGWWPVVTLTGFNSWVTSIAWNNDGSRLANASLGRDVFVWDTESWQVVESLTGHDTAVNHVAWSPDGSRLASADVDGVIIIWDMPDGRLLETVTVHADAVQSVAWNNDGSLLASASVDGSIIILDTENWQPQEHLTGHTDWVNSVAWSDDGGTLASGSDDETIIIWDTKTWQPQQTLTGEQDWFNSVAWSDSWLASGSNRDTVTIWDTVRGTADWEPPRTLSAHLAAVNSVAWNEDGSRLASASKDKTIIIWDTESWQQQTTLAGHTDWVNSVAWDNDGSRLASASTDGTIIIWAMPGDNQVLCRLAGRNLSLAEWEQYLPGKEYSCTCAELPAGEGAPPNAPGCAKSDA